MLYEKTRLFDETIGIKEKNQIITLSKVSNVCNFRMTFWPRQDPS